MHGPNVAVQYTAGFVTVSLLLAQLCFKLQFALLNSAALAKLVHCNIMLSNCTNSACFTAAAQGVSANVLGTGAQPDSRVLTFTNLVHV